MVDKMPLFGRYLTAIFVVFVIAITDVHALIIEALPLPSNQQIVQIAVKDIPFSFSPYASKAPDAQYSHLFFDPLIRWGQDKKIEFRLLAKLKPLKNNITRFYLKRNIFFHSGNLLTSRDVIWSYQEALKSQHLQQKLQQIVKIKYINKYQFDIQSNLTQIQLLDYLTYLFILDSRYYKKNKIKHNDAQIALSAPIITLPISGTGPYRVHSFYAGVNLRVQANVTYWQNQPMFKSLNFVKIQSIDSRLYALLADDIDISESIANKNINSVYLLDNKNIYQTTASNALFLMINEDNKALFEREIARNAIHLAINQVGMLKHILNGTGSIAQSLQVTPKTVQAPTYDAKRSKYLLKRALAPRTLSLLVMENERMHTKEVVLALTHMLKKVGIKLHVTQTNDIKEWSVVQFEYDLLLVSWQSSLVEESNIYQDIFINSHLTGFLDLLFKKQKDGLTMEDKIALFERYQAIDYIIPLFSMNQIWATDKHFDLQRVFSINAVAYWHLLTITH